MQNSHWHRLYGSYIYIYMYIPHSSGTTHTDFYGLSVPHWPSGIGMIYRILVQRTRTPFHRWPVGYVKFPYTAIALIYKLSDFDDRHDIFILKKYLIFFVTKIKLNRSAFITLLIYFKLYTTHLKFIIVKK